MRAELEKKGIYPKVTKSNELAFGITDMERVLEYIESKDGIVLGGDILDEDLNYTYDNWFYIPDESKNSKKNSADSIYKAKEYILNYKNRNGSSFFVVVVLKRR